MAPPELKERKVKVSLINWVAGGSLLSVPKGKGDKTRRATKVTVTQVVENATGKDETTKDKDDSNSESQSSKNQGKQSGDKRNDSSNATSVASTSGQRWTKEQDSKLREMKKENKSWKVIVAVMGASKKDIVNRYHELTQAEGGTAKISQSNGSGKEHKGDDAGFGDMMGLFDDTVNAGDDTAQKQQQPSTKGGNKAMKDKQKDGGKGQSQRPRDDEDNSIECDCPDCVREMQANRNKQSTRPGLGGGGGFSEGVRMGVLQADDIWTEDDCRILEELEKRYRENKWLEIQAGFFNWTGRMVVAEIIEQKFKDEGVV